jgi:hypothetical protein
MPPTGDPPHPLQGRWLPASGYVWGGHVSPQFVLVLLLLHALLLGWFVSDWNHVRMLLYGFYDVPSEQVINDPPEDLSLYYPYQEDPVEALSRYRPIALSLVQGTRSASESARRIGDYIYSLRREPAVLLDEDLRFGPDVLYQKMLEGTHANCGQMSTVLATFWRSLGGHTRAVRWNTTDGNIGHYALELWDAEHHRWFYYDMNLNGFAYDDATGLPLSVASLRSNLLTGEHLHVQSNPTRRDYTLRDLQETVRSYPVETYVLNNNYLRWSRSERFGLFNRYYGALAALPHPWDRIADNLTGSRDLRLVVQGRILVAGWFSFDGARVFLGYLLGMMALCLVTLRRTSLRRPADTLPPTAGDTRPSQ